ncbi:NAD(P)/FAD-dependent oxidoreductase, partial [Rhizobium ruizarguesonis]
DVFQIAITNHCDVLDVAPEGDLIAFTTRIGGRIEKSLARTVVLATGYDGAGAWPSTPTRNPFKASKSTGPFVWSNF